ncbi:MAG: hypothetical protein JKY25_06270 [Robiginitomaculum sp.]|nr:hypothetical protein [Robiginitomaculum sp.]
MIANLDKEITQQTHDDIKTAQKLLSIAREYKIDSDDMMLAAGDELKCIKSKAKDLTAQRVAITKPMDESKKRIMDLFRNPLKYLADAESLIKRSILHYDNKQEQLRREIEAKLRDKQRKEKELLVKRAAAAADKGQEEKAEALRDKAETLPTPIVAHRASTPPGVSYRNTWGAEVVDKMALIKAVAAGEVPLIALEINMKVCNAQACALRSEMKWPGIKAVSTKQIASRS